ncbi:MAG: hypothetical protein LJE62_00300 [Silicimonas sp.]|nr:hypothetical protein [Silicimonas sp.]
MTDTADNQQAPALHLFKNTPGVNWPQARRGLAPSHFPPWKMPHRDGKAGARP